MVRVRKALAASIGLALVATILTGCGVAREFLADPPIDLPQPALPDQPPPFEKIYQAGARPDGLTDEEWETTSERRITLAAAVKKILVYGVDHDPVTAAITVHIKGDPQDTQLIEDVETYVVPVAETWSPSVTVIIDASVCSVVGEVREDTPLCDAIASNS